MLTSSLWAVRHLDGLNGNEERHEVWLEQDGTRYYLLQFVRNCCLHKLFIQPMSVEQMMFCRAAVQSDLS
jgi:hypothetical protein